MSYSLRRRAELLWRLAGFKSRRPRVQVQVTDDMLKAAWAALREQAAARSKEAVAVIKPFEDGIRRPYFHVKALDSAQVVNWSRYLDFAERSGAREQVVKLYERCLVACAGYPGASCLHEDTRKPQAPSRIFSVCDRLCSTLTPWFTLCRVLQSTAGGLRLCRSCSLCTSILTDAVGEVVGECGGQVGAHAQVLVMTLFSPLVVTA